MSSPKAVDPYLLTLECISEMSDIGSFRVQEHWQVSPAHIVPLSFVPDKDAVNRKGKLY